jgi:hypothetical protein
MRKYTALAALLGLAVILAACTSAPSATTSTTGSSSTPPAPSPPAAQAVPTSSTVWAMLSSKSYKSWQNAPGYSTPQPAKGPHGKTVQIYVDPTIAKTLSGPAVTAWPVGSTIVKDAFDGTGTQIQVEYMQKTDSGWYFASFGIDGTLVKDGVEAEPCQKCHVTGSDSVKSFKLPGGSSSGGY